MHSKLLEWTSVHPKSFGVDKCPLQKFWSGQSVHSIFLECTFCAKWVQKNGVHKICTPIIQNKLEALQIPTLSTPSFYFAYSKFSCGIGSFMRSKFLQFLECNTHLYIKPKNFHLSVDVRYPEKTKNKKKQKQKQKEEKKQK
jgi:hypothetical protein